MHTQRQKLTEPAVLNWNLDTHKSSKMDWVHQLSLAERIARLRLSPPQPDALVTAPMFSPARDVYDFCWRPPMTPPLPSTPPNQSNLPPRSMEDGFLKPPLKSGDLVEIIKSKYPRKPSKTGCFVKTHRARTRILRYFKQSCKYKTLICPSL